MKKKRILTAKFPEPTQKEKLENRKKKLKSFLYETGKGILIICFVVIIPGAITIFFSGYLSPDGGTIVLVLSIVVSCFVVSWILNKLDK